MYSWLSCQRTVDFKCIGLFLDTFCFFIGLICLSLCQYNTALITIPLLYILKSRRVAIPAFFFLSIVLAIWDLLWCHMNFKIFFFSFHENVFEILILILTLLFWLKPPVLKYWKETFLFIPNLRRKHLVFHHRVILGVGFYTCFLWVLRSFFLYLAFKDYF